MIALDTNILVRYFTRDDAVQLVLARRVMAAIDPDTPAYISREVILELVWVLQRVYKFSRKSISEIVFRMLMSGDIVIEQADDIIHILELYEYESYDFTDLMIWGAAKRAGAEPLLTFDKKAATLDGGELLTDEWHP